MSLMQDLNFAGRRVLVTGAANGFGAAMAKAFAAHGAALVLADVEEAPLREVARSVGAEAHAFDQSDPASVERLAVAAGAVDVLVNNAGVLVAKPLLETSLEEIRRLVETDFIGVARLMQLVGRGMVHRLANGVQRRRKPRRVRGRQGCHLPAHARRGRRMGAPRRAGPVPRAWPVADADDGGNGAARVHGGPWPRAGPARTLGHCGGGREGRGVPRF
jgi:NAD(P)-dependent dehydrogenase (short-subunit alcohol dehydrogenase family)